MFFSLTQKVAHMSKDKFRDKAMTLASRRVENIPIKNERKD